MIEKLIFATFIILAAFVETLIFKDASEQYNKNILAKKHKKIENSFV